MKKQGTGVKKRKMFNTMGENKENNSRCYSQQFSVCKILGILRFLKFH